MNVHKYVALDVDSANIVAGVYDRKGHQLMQACVRTNSRDIREFFKGLSGSVQVTFEEGTQAAWLYDLIRPLVADVIVCDPRENRLLQSGNKADKIDVDKLARLLRLGELQAVYHGEQTIQGLKHLVSGYENLVVDTTRAMNRLKAMFRGRGIGCRGTKVFSNQGRTEWLSKLDIGGLKARAGYLYEQIDCLMKLRREAKKAMCREAVKHPAYKLVSQVPGIGPVRTAQIIATVGSPHRFRTKRQFWPYCGLAVVTRSSADYEWVGEQFRNSQVGRWFSIAVSLRFPTFSSRRFDLVSLFVWIAAAALIASGCYRYFIQPTFWLDEAFIAISLRSPSPRVIFAQLEYGQLFPRIYLGAIAIVREVFGYRIWSLRLVPFLSFIAGTLLWARLLIRRSRPHAALGFLAGALLIGATFWFEQAIQVKQYTFDVLLALAPFVIGDSFFKDTLVDGNRRLKLIAFALPCLLSYTYPFAIGARVLGWYLQQGRLSGWRLNKTAVLVLILAVLAALAGLWFTDHRFNIMDNQAYLAYWNDCLLGECLRQNAAAAPRLIAKFLWGWHGRQPLVTAVLVPLQVVGACAVIARLKRRDPDTGVSDWGSRTIGSLILLSGVILASAIVNYPICGGRVVLFTQIHTQLLALEGASALLAAKRRQRAALFFVWLCVAVVAFHSVRAYWRLVATEPAENLRPALSLINREEADAVLVLACSVAQVRSLPDPLPVSSVVLATRQTRLPQQGEKTWVLWTHLGNDDCVKELERIRSGARSWQVINEGPGRGLALAEF